MKQIMKQMITTVLCVKNLVVFGVLSLMCVIVLDVFFAKLTAALESGTELFIPGITVLFAVVILVLGFSVTRVIKYIKLLSKIAR